MGILNTIFGGKSASPDSVTFDVSRYEYQGVRDGAKVWHTSDGYGLGIFFFEKKPDIPAGLTKLSQLRDSYALLLGEKFRVVDCRVQSYDGVPAVWLIVGGLEPESHTAIYVGSITIPFRNFSYVIKMQASERGTTGMRETLLVARALKDGTGSIQDGKFVPHGWSVDDEQFDSLVPQHPLSRLRRELCSIASSINIDGKVKREAPFALPPNISQN